MQISADDHDDLFHNEGGDENNQNTYREDTLDDLYYHEGGDEALKNKYAEETENFSVENAGINRDRGCTDFLCLIFFWVFIGAMGYATFYGYKNGDVNRLTSPIDGGLNFCGFESMEGFNKMVLTNFELSAGAEILRSGVCVKECPHESGIELKEDVTCKSNDKIKCKGKKTYKSRDAFDFCLPVNKDALSEKE